MFFTISYDATGDLLADIKDMRRRLAPERVAGIAGRAVADLIRKHILEYGRTHPNKLGGVSTGYYQRAAKTTSYTVKGNVANVSVTHTGIMLRIYGGVVQAKRRKYLTIPVHALAHGKTAADMPLEPVIRHIGGKARMIGLADPDSKKMMFVMKERVRQIGDRRVVPSQAEMEAAAQAAIDSKL